MVSHELILTVKTECHNYTCQAPSLARLILKIAFGVEAASCCGTVQLYHSGTKCGCPVAPMAVLVLAGNYKEDPNAHNHSGGIRVFYYRSLFIGDLQYMLQCLGEKNMLTTTLTFLPA